MKIFFILLSIIIFTASQADVEPVSTKNLTEVQKLKKLRQKLERKNLLLVKKQIDTIRLRNQTRLARKARKSSLLIN